MIVEVPIDEGVVPLGQTIPPQLAAEIEAARSYRRHLKVCAPDNDLADIMRTSAN
jgi:hypothetical protein